jgi:hypothetical protein
MTARVMIWCHGDRDVGLGFESREHEILSQVLTGHARARGFLLEEVSGPHFEFINCIYLTTTQQYIGHNSQ